MTNPDDRFEELRRTVRARIRRDQGHWIWTGALGHPTSLSEYGLVNLTTAERRARPGRRARSEWVHRYVWHELVGPIPEGLVVDHVCRETLCCQPSHLELVTLNENSRRATPRSEIRPPGTRPLCDLDWHQPELWEVEGGGSSTAGYPPPPGGWVPKTRVVGGGGGGF